ncbi:ADP-ribosylglycohydrolase family protein [Actinomadura macra]|uniref:ADP-ribosylglycohydrolase family protein n=1 Tax=Actinomadura macra TaxID=46164 RepID=UPI00083312C9|nr:ADP-ribosylglycohydrolase family protein [Actinomadura macra]
MPELSVYPDPERLLGCLLGGAIGDALGAPLEGLSLDGIRDRYGPDGPDGFQAERFGAGAITDDTQLTMFTAHALVQASARARAKGIGGAAPGMLQIAYLTWLRGQGEEFPEQDMVGGGWLVQERALMTRRGPGRSTLSALRKAAERQRPGIPLGTVVEPINDSKGCGGVMRAAPCGFGFSDPAHAFDMGCQAAALTHGHSSGYLPAGVLAAMVWALVRGAEIPEALHLAREQLQRRPGNRETLEALARAVRLVGEGPATPERLQTLGGGWTGEEAIAIAVYVALVPGEAAERMRLAVTHGGDSDSTGAICGNILGARYGAGAFPEPWRDGVEVRGAVARLAAMCSAECGPNPPDDDTGHPTR